MSAAEAIAAGTGRYRPALQAQRIASKAHAALGEAAYHILIGQIVVPGKLMFITGIDLRLGIAGPDAAINARGSGTVRQHVRSEENTSELQSLMSNSYAVFCLKKKK